MSDSDQKDKYLQWLNDAYSMEIGLVPVLENHAGDLDSNQMDSSHLRRHIDETKHHAELVKGCIGRNGGDVSKIKAGLAKAGGALHSVSTGAFSDELIKNALGDYSAEHLEIASYISLISAAETCGDMETAATCRTILQEEIRMAEYLRDSIPALTNSMLAKA